jgi:DNA-binding transcriptional MerR regulator
MGHILTEQAMYSTGKFTKMVGIERNTMIVWLREGIAVPEETEGRNNLFSFEEAVVLRAIVPLYEDWGLGTDVLKTIADWLRPELRARALLEYDTPEELMQAIAAYRISSLVDMVSGKDFGEDYSDGVKKMAKDAGLVLPEIRTGALEKPDFGDMNFDDLKRYESLVGLTSGRGHGWFVIAKVASAFNWTLSFEEHPVFPEADSGSFVVVNLASALHPLGGES